MIRHIIVHNVSPQIPEVIGDISTTLSIILIITNTRTTSIPILPGYAAGGTRKLSQLTKTIIKVGKYVWNTCFTSCLKNNLRYVNALIKFLYLWKNGCYPNIILWKYYLLSKIVQIKAGAPPKWFPYIFPIVSVVT